MGMELSRAVGEGAVGDAGERSTRPGELDRPGHGPCPISPITRRASRIRSTRSAR
jgi:hypothetical protein